MSKWYVTGLGAHGSILVQTWHTSIGSAQIEVSVWKDRMRKRGDPAVACEIIHPGPPTRTTRITMSNIDARIDWGAQ